ncbi:MAG: nucleotide exchange factor GrpE [Prevotella sp.]|nr:nucleotide exchange factor GrpE [Prevotella sp.]MDD4533057.1 nucleotide exchange factor GrpE [Prevotella sp.]
MMKKDKKIDKEKDFKEEDLAQEETTQTTEDQTETSNSQEDSDETEAEKEGESMEGEQQQDPLEEAQQQIAVLKDQLLRTVAEFENYKKRTIREKTELILNGGQKTITAILPVLDDFERAVADKSEDASVIKEGMEMIFKKFIKSLEGMGVKKVEALDQDFNTDFHEAVAMVPGMGDDKKGKVIDCLQTGYMMNDKVIRHAKVAVAQ